MFDISFSELVLIGMVALIVVGPERLPRVARTFGHLFGRAQRYVRDIRIDIERQIEMDEIEQMKKTREEASRAVRSIEHALNREMADASRAAMAVAEPEVTATGLAASEHSAVTEDITVDPSSVKRPPT